MTGRLRHRVGLFAIFIAAICRGATNSDEHLLRGIHYFSQPDRAQVMLELNASAVYRSRILSNPARLYIDLVNVSTVPELSRSEMAGDHLLFDRIRISRRPENVTRLVLDLRGSADFQVVPLNGGPGLVVILQRATPSQIAGQKARPVVETAAAPEPAVRRPAPPAVASALPQSTQKSSATASKPAQVSTAAASHPIASSQEARTTAPELHAAVASVAEPATSSEPSADLLAVVEPGPPPPIVSVEPVPAPTVRPVKADTKPLSIPVVTATSRRLNIPRVAPAPKLEDFLGGLEGPGARITDFRQREPGDGSPASQPTSAYLSYDDANLYVVFVCKDDPSKVRAHLAKREEISIDDQVFVYLDTFRDHQHSYVFAANPLGIQEDGIFTEGQTTADYSFDTVWYSDGRLTQDGFVVWMKIPFKSVRFSNGDVQTWNVALERTITRNGENSFWPYITKRTAGFTQQMAELNGLEKVSPGRNIQFIPYATYTGARTLDPTGTHRVTENEARVGMDIKAAVTSALTLDATVNPDFSQVETDDPQVTVNQRYRVYFPEKRPFFLENGSYFQTPIDLFYTRQIVDPEFGARLTGTVDNWAIGVMGMDDRAPGELAAPGSPFAGDRAADGIVSLHREFGNQSTVGIVATTNDVGPSSNRVFSVDTRLRLSPTWFFTGQAAQSFDRLPGGVQTHGSAYFADLQRSGRNFIYEATYSDYSPGFMAALGFIQRVDIRKISQYAGYFWRPEGSKILDYGAFLGGSTDWDHHGTMQDWSGYAGLQIDFTGPSGMKFTRYQTFERYLNQGFHYDKDEVYFYTGWLKWLYLYGTVDQGSGVNYQPAGSLAPFLGNTWDASFGLTVRPAPRLRLDELYYYDRLKPQGAPVVYTDHLLRTKINYQFTRALSLRAIFDYYAVLPNERFIAQTPLKQLTADILLTYLLTPGTALYIGYNNQHQNLALDPLAPPTLMPYGPPNFLTNNQLFIKLSYLLPF